jgi:hypothetical protein
LPVAQLHQAEVAAEVAVHLGQALTAQTGVQEAVLDTTEARAVAAAVKVILAEAYSHLHQIMVAAEVAERVA